MIGIDEVGRGSWAGPLLVVAFRPKTALPSALTDSKLLSKTTREQLFVELTNCGEFGEGWVDNAEIDSLGLAGAMQLAVERAMEAVNAEETEQIIMDGTVNYCHGRFVAVRTMVKADLSQPAVSAASIYAKVVRDRHMTEVAVVYPEYGFEKHVGYGTKQHQLALAKYGPCALHRRSYKPVKAML